MLLTRGLRGLILLSPLALFGGCDEKPAPPARPAEPAAAPSTASPPPAATKPDPLAGLTVDELGPFLVDTRVDMTAKDAAAKLKGTIGKLPVKDQVVSLAAMRNAKTQDVAAVVSALGDAGAAQIDLKTPGRSGAVTVLKTIPEKRLPTSMPDCAVVGMIKKDGTSVVWHLRGGTAVKFHKGLAGPDLSMTFDGLKDQMKACSSGTWFLSGEENVIWGLTFDLGQTVATADPPLKATETVLLAEAPVAGRPVILAADKHPR
jgi:biopolymer transport protein ExbD